jgi:hypothetical protein
MILNTSNSSKVSPQREFLNEIATHLTVFGSHYFYANPESRPGAGSASKWQV